MIFKVTQDCRGGDKVIVDETVWDARWDIPQNLNVTLVGNDEACCVVGSTCPDGGSCGFISDICEDNLDDIGGNPGMSAGASQVGYLNPGLASVDGDRPYSGSVPARGCGRDGRLLRDPHVHGRIWRAVSIPFRPRSRRRSYAKLLGQRPAEMG